MKKLIIYSAVVLAALSSCSSDDEYAGIGDKFAGNVVLSAEGYEFEGGTRTSLTNTGSAIEFAWKNGEAIGVFPIAPTTNNQAKQVIETKGEGTSAVFNGAGWALLRGNSYAAYSPYSDMSNDIPYSAIPVDMTGQTQIGNASLAHIGDKYDYMYASASIPTEGNVSFDFKHVGSIVMLNMKAPASATWSKFTLANKAGNKVFTTNATMNVSNGEITSVTKSEAISLDLTNISTTLGDVMTLYMSVLPATTGELTATLTDSEGKEYVATLESKTLVAGKAYRFYIDEFVYSIPDFYYGYLYVSRRNYFNSNLFPDFIQTEWTNIFQKSNTYSYSASNGTQYSSIIKYDAKKFIGSNISYGGDGYSSPYSAGESIPYETDAASASIIELLIVPTEITSTVWLFNGLETLLFNNYQSVEDRFYLYEKQISLPSLGNYRVFSRSLDSADASQEGQIKFKK